MLLSAFLFVALLGGVGRIEGGIIGAIVYVLIDDFGRSLTERYMTIIGVFFVLMVLFFPGGIVSLQEIVRGWLSRSKKCGDERGGASEKLIADSQPYRSSRMNHVKGG